MTKIVLLLGMGMTRNIYKPSHLDQLRELGTLVVNTHEGLPPREQWLELVTDADVIFTSWGSPWIGNDILNRAPKLKLVIHAAGTVKGIVTPELADRGVRISSANEALGQGVAESALGLTIVSLKQMWQLSKDTREGEWGKNWGRVKDLYDVTIGVIGAGKAGQHYMKLLQHFNVNIVVYDPTLSADQIRRMGAEKMELESLLKISDVVSIHAPSIPETHHMFNRERLQLMRDDAILINTARGSLIDEAALAEELGKGRLWACLDVTDPEPPALDHPFRQLPNVVLIPHIAGVVNNGLHRIADYTIEELRRYTKNLPLDGEVDLTRLNEIA